MKRITIPHQLSNARWRDAGNLSSALIYLHGTWNDSKRLLHSLFQSLLTSSRHNMPSAEASAFRSQYRRSSVSEASSPSRSSFSAPHLPQQAPVPAASLPQPAGAMSIGSIIEPNMHRSSYDSHTGGHSLHDISHAPIGTAPRGLAPEFFYGMSSSGDSPLYSSSDSSHSPLSEYLQPQAVSHPYYPQEVTPRPQPVSFETCFQPIIQQSPISAEGGIPTWTGYDPSGVGFVPEAECMTTVCDSSR